MKNTLNAQEMACRKQINFDLSDDNLKKIYPSPGKTVDPRYYKKAWTDIARYMIENGFEHRQYSTYTSKVEMMPVEVIAYVKRMARCMPWMRKCFEAIDVTDIGEQFDLKPFVEDVDLEIS